MQTAGLVMNSNDNKVVRWCLNTIARIGTKEGTLGSVRITLSKYESDPEIVASAVAALAHLFHGDISTVSEVSDIRPETRTLAAMQIVGPRVTGSADLRIDIETADIEVIKLALIVIGLNHDVENLFHPRHKNGELIRALGSHDDPIVRQYGVWAIIENDSLGPQHLGVPLERLEYEPPNVQAKLLQLGSTAINDFEMKQEFILAGSNLESIDAREGLAKGLLSEFYDGLQDITVPWMGEEASNRVRLLLAEHMARYSEEVPTYSEEALRLANESADFRERILLGAEGRPLYGKIQRMSDSMSPGLFDDSADPMRAKLIRNTKEEATTKVLMLNASPDDEERIRVDIEGRDVQEALELIRTPKRLIEITQRHASRLDQIQKELLAISPKILHFSGHGDEDVLIFETRDGQVDPLDGSVLADMIKAYGGLECVVLHSCFSHRIASACKRNVQFVIGSTREVDDTTASGFSRAFYQALAYGRTYKNAFDMGVIEVKAVSAAAAGAYIFLDS
ncbi:MAG: hypothetical protein RIM72_00410 [Alphaproteobacteria bacterium]